MELRAYDDSDADATLAIYLRAIRETASADYTPRQIAAWASQHGDRDAWAVSRAATDTRVAGMDGRLVGFTDLDEAGHIDMLFVAPDSGRQGVATTLLASTMDLARRLGMRALTTHASLTARALFERHGFVAVEERHPVHRGVELRNYAMRCNLTTTPGRTARSG